MTLNFALLQSDLVWEDPQKNIRNFSQLIKRLPQEIDVVLLPETFNTGFTMDVENNADKNHYALNWMKDTAAKRNISIAGSLITKENGHYYNRLHWVNSDQTIVHYDKRHLFRMGREKNNFKSGERRVIVEQQGLRILLQICYDIRFPVFSRNQDDYDAILYVANFPTARKNVWKTLLMARAIENQAYVLAVNRVGIDGEGVDNCGMSCVVDMQGNYKARLDDKPGIISSSIDVKEIRLFREKFPAHLDADRFKLL